MKLVLLLSSLLFSVAALAGDCHCGIHNSPYDFSGLIEQVNVIGYTDPRITYEKYATDNGLTVDEVYEKFNANDRVYCGGKMESGNVVKPNVVLAAAHTFYEKDCTPKVKDFSTCYLQTIPGPGKTPVKYPIAAVSKCVPWDDEHRNLDNVAIKLKDKIDGVHPYPIRSNCQLAVGFAGTNVAAAHNNFGDPKHPPPAIGPCAALNADNGSFKTNCSAGGWGSGSGILCDTKGTATPAISGILVTTITDPNYDFKGYDPDHNFTRAIPITDDMIKKINDMK
jgi:hypothetical protein